MGQAIRILVPVDGSRESEAILPALRPYLRARPAEVTVLRVIEDPQAADAAREALQRVTRSLLLDGVRASSRLEWGRPADAIEYLARPERHDLLAMTSRTRSGPGAPLLGNVAETLMRRATLPLLLQRPDGGSGDLRRLLLALDGSGAADEILRDLEPFALAFGATVHVLQGRPRAGEPDPLPRLEAVCEQLEARGIPATPLMLPGTTAAALLAHLRSRPPALLALTSRGRDDFAEELARECPVPLLVRRLLEAPVVAPA